MLWFIVTIYCWAVTCIITFLCSALIILSLILPGFLRRLIVRHIPQVWGRLLIWGNLGRLLIIHLKSPPQGPVLYMSNHLSQTDIPVLLAALPKGLCFISKKEVFAIPVLGWAMRGLNYISVDRGSRHQAIRSIERAGERIRNEGLSVWISPEGTRSPDGNLGPFKKGPFHLALQAGVPIIPVYLYGTNHVLPKKKLVPSPRSRMAIIIGQPLTLHMDETVDSEAILGICRERLVEMDAVWKKRLEEDLVLSHPRWGVREILL